MRSVTAKLAAPVQVLRISRCHAGLGPLIVDGETLTPDPAQFAEQRIDVGDW
jgi:hypothetical protein